MPNFKGKSGGGPFKMKAAAHGNNPMLKNFPSTFKQREMLVSEGTGGAYDKPQVMNVAIEDSAMKQVKDAGMGKEEPDFLTARGRAATGTEGMYRGAPTPTRKKKKY